MSVAIIYALGHFMVSAAPSCKWLSCRNCIFIQEPFRSCWDYQIKVLSSKGPSTRYATCNVTVTLIALRAHHMDTRYDMVYIPYYVYRRKFFRPLAGYDCP